MFRRQPSPAAARTRRWEISSKKSGWEWPHFILKHQLHVDVIGHHHFQGEWDDLHPRSWSASGRGARRAPSSCLEGDLALQVPPRKFHQSSTFHRRSALRPPSSPSLGLATTAPGSGPSLDAGKFSPGQTRSVYECLKLVCFWRHFFAGQMQWRSRRRRSRTWSSSTSSPRSGYPLLLPLVQGQCLLSYSGIEI